MGWPGISELRCDACTLTGGLDVEDEEIAKGLSQMFAREVVVGERVEEQPCEPPHFPEQLRGDDGLPCPRTTLRPDNDDAALLLQCAIHEDLREHGPALEQLMNRYATDEYREELLRRVVATVVDERVAAARRAAFDREMKKRAPKD